MSAQKPAGNLDTPMMRQWLQMKEIAPDCVLFFRMGDFYEMFFEDAKLGSRIMGVALTSRDKASDDPIPMCGVPHHAVDNYLARMIEAGFKVAVCDQVEDPKIAKGLVKREITRVVSPGMYTDPNHLPARDNRFLAALFLGKQGWGLAHLDLASGEFAATNAFGAPALLDELARLEPAELVLAETQAQHPALAELGQALSRAPISHYPGRPPRFGQALDLLDSRAPAESDPEDEPALVAAAMALAQVAATQRLLPEHLAKLSLYRLESHLVLDATARRNLELFRSIAEGGRKGSLLAAVDKTATAMGGRLLREWLGFPLLGLEVIEARHQAVGELLADPLNRSALSEKLAQLPDMPRLVGRASLGSAGPKDLAQLRDALAALPGIREDLARFPSPLLAEEALRLEGLGELAGLLARTLAESPPLNLADGGVIALGVSPELDEQRQLAGAGKGWIAKLQAELRSQTGIGSLKMGFNKVFGYYIEVTKAHLDKVPDSFIRKQTLAGAERYFTPELKDKEAAVLGAEEKVLALERAVFEDLRTQVAASAPPLMAAGLALATVDVLAGLAELAGQADYCRPEMADQGDLLIEAGRHPVVERMMPAGDFVPNDLTLGGESQVIIITGPNMAGKSTILRQAALIVLLAQAGSFVPAKSARIPLVDRIFTRVGAMDDLARGRSTFMVEMTETAEILKQATPRSLVVLDEVGRGTSTFDGLSIAWAVAEHLHDLNGRGVKTLFATHYHELTDLAATHPRVKNFNVAVKEYGGKVVFLRRLAPGGVSRSYGIQVASLAGLPENVLQRAREILVRLEQGESALLKGEARPGKENPGQLALFSSREPSEVEKRLREVNLEELTPLAALNLLNELKGALA